mgnify:CR=1 FL=1
MSLGISKLEILFQMILEAFLIGIVAVSLSFLAAPMAAKTAAEYLVVQQEQQAQLQEDQTANQIQTEYVAPELTVTGCTDISVSIYVLCRWHQHRTINLIICFSCRSYNIPQKAKRNPERK